MAHGLNRGGGGAKHTLAPKFVNDMTASEAIFVVITSHFLLILSQCIIIPNYLFKRKEAAIIAWPTCSRFYHHLISGLRFLEFEYANMGRGGQIRVRLKSLVSIFNL